MTKLIRTAVAVLLLLALAVPCLALDESRDFYVSDGASVLTDEVEETVKKTNEALFALTGAEIVVVTVGKADGLYETANAIISENEIGSVERSNGILLFISADDGGYWYIPTTGIADVFEAGRLDGIVSSYLVPAIAKRDYTSAVLYFVTETAKALADAYGVDLDSYDGTAGRFTKVGITAEEQLGMTPVFRLLLYVALALLVTGVLVIVGIVIWNRISHEQRHTIRRRKPRKNSTALTFARGIDSVRRR